MSIHRLVQTTLLLALAPALPALAGALGSGHGCTKVQGHLTEYVADTFLSPFDSLGRVVNFSDGTIQSVGTAVLTSVGPGPTQGTVGATAKRTFVLNQKDQIVGTDVVVLTPIANTTDVDDVVTTTIVGGLGKFANATGQIVATGRGFNFFPGPTAGNSYFSFTYEGQVCLP